MGLDVRAAAARAAASKREQVARLQGVKHDAQARARELYDQQREQAEQGKLVVETHRALDLNIPGLFPTHQDLAAELVEMACIRFGHSVLEPEAGTGNIAEAIRSVAGCEPVCIEVNWTLADMLRRRGFNVLCADFLTWTGEVDRIVMNPPFEGGADIEHVMHAFGCLKPGGRMVSVMAAATFTHSDRQAIEFRDWLESVGGEHADLPDGSFESSRTGVRTCVVTIDK